MLNGFKSINADYKNKFITQHTSCFPHFTSNHLLTILVQSSAGKFILIYGLKHVYTYHILFYMKAFKLSIRVGDGYIGR